ncbi:MAG: YicC/YloC family endoribonuclease [Xanthomonadales bacterium]|nr:YicC/YloC family endoribonuclease [Xanthomonadales bacterium]
MIRSMTGFAGAEAQFEFGRLSWEIRSVNHRYLEIGLRLPEEFRPLEPVIRERIGQHLSRGKVDAGLRYHPAAGAGSGRLALNEELGRKLLDLHRALAELAGRQDPPDLASLLRWPGLVEESPPDVEPMHEAAMDLLDQAVAGLREAREREGEQLARALRERLDGVEHWSGVVRELLPEIREALRSKMLDRIGELQQPLDPGRLEQEVAFLAQKADVDEELDRLQAHVLEARRTLDKDEPVGRRLDFLMQEFNRESNTLSSKSTDPRTTQAAVELKVLIEQMREQVQNVE